MTFAVRLPWAAAAAALGRAGGIDWRRGAVQAAWMGLAVTSLEALSPQAVQFDQENTYQFLFAMFVMWTTRAMPLAWTAQWSEGRLSSRALVLVFVAEVALLSATWDSSAGLTALTRAWFGAWLPSDGHYLYTMWVMLVYGSAFFAYCLLAQRSLRVRALLDRAEIERARSSALIGAAQAEVLEGRVDPTLMLRTIVALRDAYATDRARAENILDALVAFLRMAMPAVRSGRSTLLGELALLAAYAQLMACVEGTGAVCKIDAIHPAGDAPFPPMLLIPLVERLGAAQGARRQPVRLTLVSQESTLRLTIDGGVSQPWIDDMLALRLDRALFAAAAPARDSMQWQIGPSQALTLTLPLMPANPEEVCDE